MKKALKLSFLSILIPVWVSTLAVVWFIPWVFVLHSGLLFYFPYKMKGSERYLRVSGPITSLWSDQWVPQEEIPTTCKQALVASEDANFHEHYGIDLKSIKENMIINKKAQRIKRGGSTITQQIVKNAFLSRERSYLRKAREMVGALLLDISMPKELQKTWYLNIIEFGPNIYGLQQAASFYFKTKAQDLTPSQCVALVTIVPSPLKWNKGLVNHRPTPFFVKRYYKILSRMRQMSLDNPKNLRRARSLSFWSSPAKAKKKQNVSSSTRDWKISKSFFLSELPKINIMEFFKRKFQEKISKF